MTKFIIIIASLITLNAYACPNLSGRFQCQSDKGPYMKTFKPTANGILITTESTKKEYKTDGSIEELPDLGENVQNRTLKSFCEANKLLIDYRATIYHDGSILGEKFSETSYEFKGKNIEMILQVNFRDSNLPTIKETCMPY